MVDQKDLITFGGYAVTALAGSVATFILAYITARTQGKSNVEIAFAANRETFVANLMADNENLRDRIDELEKKLDVFYRDLQKSDDRSKVTEMALQSHLARCKGEHDVDDGESDDEQR